MKILAFSDLHRNHEIAQAIVDASMLADVVVGAGDFATKGEGLTDTLEILRHIPVPVVFVAGNHDCLAEMQGAMQNWRTAHLLHGTGAVIQGIPFFGLGYEIPAGADKPWNQRLEETEASDLLVNCPEGAVLVTHSPPFGVADLQRNGRNEGSRAILSIIEHRQPRLVLCGHIHNAWGMTGTIGSCRVHNLGPSVHWFEV
ncbi:MAG: serine/threonine protein phosphatase [Rhizobiales bacterium PAR1]|nr:MAG: serine/threonine protein phosphatase [Rhizobiales bacterium PAR1]